MKSRSIFSAAAASWAGWLVLASGVCAQTKEEPAREEAPTKMAVTPVTAVLLYKKQEFTVTLISRTKEKVVGVLGENTPVGIRREFTAEDVDAAYFNLAVDPAPLDRAIVAQDWATAVKMLLPLVKPTLPFLDLKNNNAAQKALEVGDYMMRIGDIARQTAKGKAEEDAAKNQYKMAFTVLRYASQAKWCAVGQAATLKTCRCLLALEKPETARKLLESVPDPSVGDATFGLYWLVKAELDVQKGDFRSAVDSVVKSVAFENKDIDTFPDALMVSARCHEELQEWYRARDVYYEVASLFAATMWSKNARERLKFIMDKGLTKADEKESIENVFFGLKEDVNKKVKELLASEDSRVIEKTEETKRPAEKTATDAKFVTKEKKKEKKDEEKEGDEPPPQ
jgi:hypothetical protein